MKINRENIKILETLKARKGIVKVILDTDTYNEIDVSDEISLIKKEVKDPEYGLIDLAFDKEISDPILYVGGSHLALILYLFGEELS